jgi:dihydroxyacetone synthase
MLALSEQEASHPSLISLSRQAVPLLDGSDRAKVAKGAYIIYGGDVEPELTLVSTGCEVYRAVEVAKAIGGNVRVVSMPSQRHFDLQPKEYRQSVLPTTKSLVVAIEAWGSLSWPRYAHAGCHMHTFGLSAPQDVLYKHFGFGPDNLAKVIKQFKEEQKGGLPGVGEFAELLNGHMLDGRHYAGKLDMNGNE